MTEESAKRYVDITGQAIYERYLELQRKRWTEGGIADNVFPSRHLAQGAFWALIAAGLKTPEEVRMQENQSWERGYKAGMKDGLKAWRVRRFKADQTRSRVARLLSKGKRRTADSGVDYPDFGPR